MITKEKFIAAYNKYLPGKWIKFAFKYFSTETEKDEEMKLNNTVVIILMSLFGIGFFCSVTKLLESVLGIVTVIYSLILCILVFYLFSAVFANNHRIKKITKELNCTKKEYEKALKKWGDELDKII